MERFIIEGRTSLKGEISIGGNKNSALPLLASVLLTSKEVRFRNLPEIGDILTLIELLRELGVKITKNSDNSWSFLADRVNPKALSPALCKKIRASILLLGPLLARFGRISLYAPGGDVIGRRRVDTHILTMKELGAEFHFDGLYNFTASRLKGKEIFLDEPSVTATENAIMAAVTADGRTILENVASEPHIQDLCNFLNSIGAKISGISTNCLTIEGISELSGGDFTISPDHIEIGSFIGLAACTGGGITLKNCSVKNLKKMSHTLSKLGIKFMDTEKGLHIPENQLLEIENDFNNMIPQIDDGPWPAFPADLMSIAIVVATQARGTVLFFEKMFESRMFFVDRLIDMGAKLVLCDPHRVVVSGPSLLNCSEMASPDIRAGMALLIACLAAKGTSRINNIEQIDRGYEKIEEKIIALGGKIRREKNR